MKKIYFILSVLCASLFAASCSNDAEGIGEQGYLKLKLTTLVSTHTRATSAPANYDAKQLHVELLDANNAVVMATDDFENATDFQGTITLDPGTYTIKAYSANWDGSDSGFDTPYYSGETQVTITSKTLTTAALTLTLANVKVTVNYDQSFLDNFASAEATVTSDLSGVASRSFVMGQTTASAYFPEASMTLSLAVENLSGDNFTQQNRLEDVKARDHFIITYKVADYGNQGGVTVYVDDATQTYSYTVEVPRKSSIALQAANANAWSCFAYLSGAVTSKTSDFDATGVTLQWKAQSATDWITVDNASLTTGTDSYSYKLTGLTAETAYTYRFVYTKDDVTVNSNEVNFTTEAATALYNGGFENWYQNGNVWYPNESGTSFWDTSNPGSAGLMGANYNVTTSTTTMVHGGSSAAKLASMYVIIKFAAASLYTGTFGSLNGTKSAILNWGVPFTSRPTALKGYMSYTPGAINRGSQPSGVGAPASGENDYCQIRVALMTEALTVDNGDMSTFPAWDGTDSRILAYGTLEQNTSDGGSWKSFNIPLTYYNTTTKPSYMLIVCSSSKFGDYFYGSDSSVLYLDDFEFEYGDTPTVSD